MQGRKIERPRWLNTTRLPNITFKLTRYYKQQQNSKKDINETFVSEMYERTILKNKINTILTILELA